MKTLLVNFIIPKELLKEVDKIAKRQYKSRSETLREAAKRLVDEVGQTQQDFAMIERSAKNINLSEDQAISLVESVRAKLSLNR